MNRAQHTGFQRAGEKARLDPFFLGHLLSRLRKRAGRVQADLANRLNCDLTQINRLFLCRSPREDAVGFRQDVEKIAAYVGCDAFLIAQIVREANTAKALTAGGPARTANTLLAARDRLPKKPDADSSEGIP